MRIIENSRLMEQYLKTCKSWFGCDLSRFPVRILRFEKGELICCAEEPLAYLCFIISGRAKTYSIMENGKRFLSGVYQRPELVGDLELLSDTPINSYVEALGETDCLGIALEGNKMKLLNDLEILRVMGRELAVKLKNSTRFAAAGLTYPLEQRLADYILNTEYNGIFSEHMGELSELMGTSYRHLLRSMKNLCETEVLEKNGSRYRIKNREELRRIAGTN